MNTLLTVVASTLATISALALTAFLAAVFYPRWRGHRGGPPPFARGDLVVYLDRVWGITEVSGHGQFLHLLDEDTREGYRLKVISTNTISPNDPYRDSDLTAWCRNADTHHLRRLTLPPCPPDLTLIDRNGQHPTEGGEHS
ncbi:MAG: hypothetical protein ACRCYU_02910 [Nocardioides sp.]